LSEDDQTSILKVLVQLRDEATEPLKKVSESFEAFSDSLHGIWYSALEIGAGYEMLKGIIEPASAFEDAQVGLRMVTNDSAEALKQFQEQAEELSIKFPKSAEDITTAQENMYKKLGDVGATLKATEIATQLATALRVDATTGSNILGSAFENLKIKGMDTNESLEKLSDNLALLRAGFLKSDAPVGNMERDLRQLGQVAGKTHVDVDQLFTVWAELSKLGQGGRAGAAIVVKGIIDKLTESNKNGTNELARYGLHIQRTKEKHLDLIATLKQIAGLTPSVRSSLVNQMKGQNDALGLLIQNTGDMDKILAQFNDDEGEAAKRAKEAGDTMSSHFKEMTNAAQNLGVALGSGLKPQMDGITDSLKGFTVAVTEFSKAHPELVKIGTDFGLMAAGLVTLTGVVGVGKLVLPFIELAAHVSGFMLLLKTMQGAWALTVALFTGGLEDIGLAFGLVFESNPIGWIITGVAAIAIGSYEIYKHWGDIRDAIEGAASAVDSFLHVASFKDWGNVIGDVATGNFAAAGADIGMTAAANYAPTVHVHVSGDADPQAIGGAVHGALRNSLDDWMNFQRDAMHQDARRSFGNPALEGAR